MVDLSAATLAGWKAVQMAEMMGLQKAVWMADLRVGSTELR